tara:strand:+ start:979 stop:1527 length:549 start_codon:yes stop_codon:yes gene_type:complete
MSEEIKHLFIRESIREVKVSTRLAKIDIDELRKKYCVILKQYFEESCDVLTKEEKKEISDIKNGVISNEDFIKKYIENGEIKIDDYWQLIGLGENCGTFDHMDDEIKTTLKYDEIVHDTPMDEYGSEIFTDKELDEKIPYHQWDNIRENHTKKDFESFHSSKNFSEWYKNTLKKTKVNLVDI